ncbi:MAG: COX15/CtaA family protein [Alphaproteobacteria bacterium]
MKAGTLSPSEAAARNRLLVGGWLLLICAMLALMVIVGGATRLTNSGLSITEWRPVTGVIPPTSEAAWQAEFDKYQRIPQYQYLNKGMSLEAFKSIYWWEWGHRLLGRLIGFVVLLPFIWFLVARKLGGSLIKRIVLIFALGGAQGVLGWWMVSSGLANRVEVSQYRLAAHLGLAFIIFALTFWTALSVLRTETITEKVARSLRGVSHVLSGLVFCQVLLGALVAGLRAGYRYNTWPLMEGSFLPRGFDYLKPFWRNFTENQALAQFDHRILAYVIAASMIALWLWARPRAQSAALRRALDLCLAAVCVQVALGIWTLLAVVPVPLGLLHQTGALLLFAATINLAHVVRREPKRVVKPVSPAAGVAIQSLGSDP